MNRQSAIYGFILVGVTLVLWTGGQTLKAAQETVSFYNSGQTFSSNTTIAADAVDLTGNGQLDVVSIGSGVNAPSQVWLNQDGVFSAGGPSPTASSATGLALADLNNDGAADAFVTIGGVTPPNQIWLNDGSGQLTDSGLRLGNQTSNGVALGDLNGDLLNDAFVANQGANRVYLQQSGGIVTHTAQALGSSTSYAVALADLDGDTDLDAYVANGGSGSDPDRVWTNNGSGQFSDSGQTLGLTWSYDVSLGDLDGNGSIDAVTANWVNGGGRVYLNNGSAAFTSGQTLGSASSLGVDLADFDGDGDLDVILATYVPDGSEIWLNQGNGTFVAGPVIETAVASYAAVAENFDDDTSPDIFLANFGADALWLNGIPGLPKAKIDIERETNSGGRPTAFWSGSGSAQLDITLNKPAAAAVEVKTRVQGTTTVTETTGFSAGQQTGQLTIANPTPGTTITLTVLTGFAGAPSDQFVQTDALELVIVAESDTKAGCILCFIENMLRFLGFNPTFGALHHVDYGSRAGSPEWVYYAEGFSSYSPELAVIAITHPIILIDGYQTLEAWTPALETFNGSGDGQVTQEMVDGTNKVLDRFEQHASPELGNLIAHEQATLDLDSWAGLTVSEMWDDIATKKQPTTLYMPVVKN